MSIIVIDNSKLHLTGCLLLEFIKKWKPVVTDYSDIIILNNLLEYLPDKVNIDVIKRINNLEKKWSLKYNTTNENNL